MNQYYDGMKEWLDEVLQADMPAETQAYNFNIYEDGGENWSIELIAANSFDACNEDWACDEIFATRENPYEIVCAEDWEKVLDIFTECVMEYLKTGKYAEKLKLAQAVGTGFVDGNIVLLYQK